MGETMFFFRIASDGSELVSFSRQRRKGTFLSLLFFSSPDIANLFFAPYWIPIQKRKGERC